MLPTSTLLPFLQRIIACFKFLLLTFKTYSHEFYTIWLYITDFAKETCWKFCLWFYCGELNPIILIPALPNVIAVFSAACSFLWTQLTYDYKFELEDEQHKIPCLCGAENCRGFMNFWSVASAPIRWSHALGPAAKNSFWKHQDCMHILSWYPSLA